MQHTFEKAGSDLPGVTEQGPKCDITQVALGFNPATF